MHIRCTYDAHTSYSIMHMNGHSCIHVYIHVIGGPQSTWARRAKSALSWSLKICSASSPLRCHAARSCFCFIVLQDPWRSRHVANAQVLQIVCTSVRAHALRREEFRPTHIWRADKALPAWMHAAPHPNESCTLATVSVLYRVVVCTQLPRPRHVP